VYIQRSLIASLDRNKAEHVQQNKKEQLMKLIRYCSEEETCRRKLLLSHFGQTFEPASCKGMCDNCLHQEKFDIHKTNVTDQANALLDIGELYTHISIIT